MIGSAIAAVLSDLAPWFALAVLSVLGAWGYGARKERQGRKAGREETYMEIKARDHEQAAEIRKRVDTDLSQRVRDLEDTGYRD